MRAILLSVALIAAGSLVGAASAVAQADVNSPHKRVFGYQDSVTGEFHSSAKFVPEATTTPTTGTDTVVLTITLKTPLPKGGSIVCGSNLSAFAIYSTGTSSTFEETAASVATVSGSTATCTVNIPYSWLVATGAEQESYSGSYTIEMLTGAGAAPGAVRTSDGTYVSATKIPATGTTSKFTVAATI